MIRFLNPLKPEAPFESRTKPTSRWQIMDTVIVASDRFTDPGHGAVVRDK
jgi:hypothetical protein